jgi:hypothetical protein
VKGLQLEERYLSMLAHILSFFVSFFFLKKKRKKKIAKEREIREIEFFTFVLLQCQ